MPRLDLRKTSSSSRTSARPSHLKVETDSGELQFFLPEKAKAAYINSSLSTLYQFDENIWVLADFENEQPVISRQQGHVEYGYEPAKQLSDRKAAEWFIKNDEMIPRVLERFREQIESEHLHRPQSGTDSPYLFKRDGAYFDIRFEGESGRIPVDSLGARFAYLLLMQPNNAWEAIELRCRANAMLSKTSEQRPQDLGSEIGMRSRIAENTSATDREMNRESLASIHHRINSIKSDLTGDHITEQERHRLEQEEQALRREVSRLTHGGKPRDSLSGDANQSARVAVRQALTTLQKNCREKWQLGRLAHHLDCIRTEGTAYTYRPNPNIPWEF